MEVILWQKHIKEKNIICDKCKCEAMETIERLKEYNVKGKHKITILEKVLKCKNCGEIIFDEKLEKENLKNLYAKYREEKGLISPEEIKLIRDKYDIGQRVFAKILGWGEITVHRYEKDSIIDEAHSKTLLLIKNPENMKTLLEESKDKISETQYKKILKKIEELEEKKGDYVIENISNRMDEYSGYVKFNFEKFKNAVLYMIKNSNAIYQTKLWKETFYVDIGCYKENLVSATGAVYIKNHYGPTPLNHSTILAYLVDKLNVIDIDYDNYGNEILIANEEPDISIFDNSEIDILKKVAEKFKSFSSKEIKDYSHNEKAWLEPNFKDLISLDKYADEIML